MLRKLNSLNIFFGYFFFIAIIFPYNLNVSSEEFSKIELTKELKKGNFLIGLKQYLGGKNDIFSKNRKIIFKTQGEFITLYSLNGIKYKSKKFNITWKEIPTKTPFIVERLVFGPFASYESAKKQEENLREKGYEANVAYPKNWEVWIPIENGLPPFEFKNKVFKKIQNTQIIPYLSDEDTLQKLDGPIFISSDEDININNVNFGKKFYLVQDSYGTWTLIQKINFDDYLRGVLPYEIGLNAPLEALKAQAVIARTWGIYNYSRFSMDNYHLCVTTQCQVYKPFNLENSKVNKAINATSNLILTYKNQPINSFYHGSSGGITAKASESWQIEDESYLKTKIDGSKSLNNFFSFPIQNKTDLNKFLNFDEEKFYGNYHSRFRWKREVSGIAIANKLINNKLINNNDKILNVKVIKRGLSGRATKLEIKIKRQDTPIILLKDEIRRIFTFLPSNLFTINKLNDDLWQFSGGGFGHGVGLSQAGAIEMAKLGFTYEQILNHYFQGAKLEKIEILSQ